MGPSGSKSAETVCDAVAAANRGVPAQRFLLLAIVFAIEALVFSIWLDNASLASLPGLLPRFLARWDAWIVRGVVGWAAIFFTFAFLKDRAGLAEVGEQAQQQPVRKLLLAAHLALLAGFAALSSRLFGGHWGRGSPDLAAFLWITAGGSAFLLGSMAFVAPALWVRLIRRTGFLSAYALAAVALACLAGAYIRDLWAPMGRVTFGLVEWMLQPFLPAIVADPVKMILGSPRFQVEVAPQCSGFEGVGLILAFGVLWLCLFRRESRFPQALVLLPAGVATIFLLNAVRLAALILIGNSGAEQIALGGFHSQAGWISFNIVALGFALAARRARWIAATGGPSESNSPAATLEGNPTAAYLLPFLSILLAGFLAAGVSGGFEWLYPLRFFAAAGALWAFRSRYAQLDWSVSWVGPFLGVVVFAIWIGADLVPGSAPLNRDAMPDALAASPAALRIFWLAIRVLAATVTVPIAEELAFRGFAIRRWLSPDFESLPLSSFTWVGLAVSSVAFGLLHGRLWLPGIAAGLMYGWAMLRRGKFGDAVVAPATTNALLAAYVLSFGKWHLW